MRAPANPELELWRFEISGFDHSKACGSPPPPIDATYRPHRKERPPGPDRRNILSALHQSARATHEQ